MSQFRRDEIKRTLDQMRDTLTFVRAAATQAGSDMSNDDRAIVDQGTAFAAAFIDLVGGMASDLNEINEKLSQAE